ncbi:hypothetical protein ACTJIJ_19915 [Niabella sp. 22666]|uniref:hypothetical protein n=1 Tax=Niabella sp. 22666 TaxID=3453954 RepID=UPI003F83D70B
MATSYANIVRPSNPLTAKGGYKDNFYFAPTRDFTTIAKPVVSATPVLGEVFTIGTAHTFTSPKGFHNWELKKVSVLGTSTTVGDDGEKLPLFNYELIVLGDSASTQEQVLALLNDDIICMFKDSNCLEDEVYVQLGDECNSPTFDVQFDGKTNKEGMKQWKVIVQSNVRYFYTATVTMAA